MVNGFIRVEVVGHPIDVQRIADVLDAAFPGTLVWQDVADVDVNGTIAISGESLPVMESDWDRALSSATSF